MHILLVEPDYYTRYPPLGLLKLSSYHRSKVDTTELVRGKKYPIQIPDKIYVTSLFSWAWQPVWDAVQYYKIQFPNVELSLGGIYASLLPDHARRSGADYVHTGVYHEADDFIPDYSLVPNWDASILFASRGCIRKCGFCSVPKIEGRLQMKESIKSLIYPGHKKIILFDNDILGAPNWRDIFDELIELNLPTDFNQGLDARLVTDEVAERLSKMKMRAIRLAFDYSGIKKFVERAIVTLNKHGIKSRRLIFYTLYNYVDSPNDFYERVKALLEWGVVVYPMKFEPLSTLYKGKYVSPKWNSKDLDLVQRARRVIGYAGAFPPYEGLVKKFTRANDFYQAFALRPTASPEEPPSTSEALKEMALEHEITVQKRNFFPGWRREKDWRKI
jgi:hypothetical protein